MKKLIPLAVLLLLCVFGAGCIIEIDDIETTHPTDPTPKDPIVGEWEGYDSAAKTTYSLECYQNKNAELETEDKSSFPEIELTKRGTWEGSDKTYTLKLSGEEYALTIAEDKRTAELKTPDGKKVTMYRDY